LLLIRVSPSLSFVVVVVVVTENFKKIKERRKRKTKRGGAIMVFRAALLYCRCMDFFLREIL